MTAIDDLAVCEANAEQRLDRETWAYLQRGSGEGVSLTDNLAAWRRLRLRPGVMRGVGSVDTATTVLGQRLALPVLVAPTGRATRYHPMGEAEILKGAGAAGSLAVLPSSVADSLETLVQAAPETPRWLQLYFDADRGWMAETVARARRSGCTAVVLTVDLVPAGGGPPPPPPAPWETPSGRIARPLYSAATLADLAWLAEMGDLPVIVKGVLRADDAAACVSAGASGLIVSNHGGNQLDGAVATADVLESVVVAVRGQAEVFVDGGIRHGVSVLKALALGAGAVLIGRPASWGLAIGGADGVCDVLDVLRGELERAMTLCGSASVTAIERSLIA